MPHFIFPSQPIRHETGEAAATLIRKGWTELPEQPDPDATWDGQQWVSPEPPLPEPQWVNFGSAVLFHPSIRAFAAANPVDYPALVLGFGQAAQGDSQTLMMLWPALRQAGAISQELAETVATMAANFNLPAEFIDGLTA